MYNKEEILQKVDRLYNMWNKGCLGGEVMPEDANPHLEKFSMENYLYFTLPMALNYQRNSYKLWESALNTYNDKETSIDLLIYILHYGYGAEMVLRRLYNESVICNNKSSKNKKICRKIKRKKYRSINY